MDMTGERRTDPPRAVAWQALNDATAHKLAAQFFDNFRAHPNETREGSGV